MGRYVKSGCMLGIEFVRTLHEYRETYGAEPNYIVMSTKTLNVVEAFIADRIYADGGPNYPVYNGVPIAVCNKLSFGEFEVV